MAYPMWRTVIARYANLGKVYYRQIISQTFVIEVVIHTARYL